MEDGEIGDETNETNREIIMLWTIVEQSEMSECDENNNNMSEKLCIVRQFMIIFLCLVTASIIITNYTTYEVMAKWNNRRKNRNPFHSPVCVCVCLYVYEMLFVVPHVESVLMLTNHSVRCPWSHSAIDRI